MIFKHVAYLCSLDIAIDLTRMEGGYDPVLLIVKF